jgi:3'-5' exonuclease
MATLIFHIETAGIAWEDFGESIKKHLLNKAKRTDVDIEVMVSEFGLSAFTGSIVSLGVYDLERQQGAVYFVGVGEGETFLEGDYTFKERTEKELLEDFWDGALSYDTFVTFNGRSFDIPFILHRSVACGVKPTVDLLGARYLTKQALPYHVALQDELSFYGAIKLPSLQMVCHGYEIAYKKDVASSMVTELIAAKQFRTVAEQNAESISAIVSLYKKWKEYLAPVSFLNAVEL